MRTAVVFAATLVGAVLGLASSLDDGWGVRIVMMVLGAGIAAPIGAAVESVAGGMAARAQRQHETDGPHGTSPESLAENFWRDRGHAPFMRPRDGVPDHHQFDPDRQN